MKIAILAFVALAVALPTSLQPRQEDVNPVSSSSTPESLLDAIPVNLVASIRRPNGDVIGILKTRRQVADPLEPLDMNSDDVRADADEAVAKVTTALL